MSIFNMPQGETALELIGRSFGGGIGQGISTRIDDMLTKKQNKNSAKNLLAPLNLPDNVVENLTTVLSSVPADKQTKALLDFYDITRAAPQLAKAFTVDKNSFQNAVRGESPEDQLRASLQEMFPHQASENASSGGILEQSQERQPPITAREERETKFRQAEETIGLKKAKLNLDETKDYRSHIANQARSAEELDPVLDQMEKLIKNGKLTNPVIAKLADKAGLVGLLDPSSQQFQALAIGFLKDAKNIFGSRVTNFDLETYLDKIPRLAQTNEGKKVLIDNFRTMGEAAKVRNKALHEVIRQNKGVPPLDIEEKVSEKIKPQLDEIAKKFNKSFIESSKAASGKIKMRHPNGTLGEVPEDKVEEAMKKGYTLG